MVPIGQRNSRKSGGILFLKPCQIAVILLFALCLTGVAPPAFALGLLGNWTYRQSGGDNQETQSSLQQSYQLTLGPSVTLRPSQAITLSGGVGYRNTQRDTGNGFETVEQISPYAQFTLTNDIFATGLSANNYITLAGSENSTAYWNYFLGSTWDVPYWPNIHFNYGEDFVGVDRAALFDDSAGKNQNTSISVSWDLYLAELYYEFTLTEVVDNEGNNRSNTESHFVRLETGGRFWADRINYNLTQDYRVSTAEFDVSGSGTGAGDGFFDEFVPVVAAGAEVVDNPATGPDPEDVNPPINENLTNNDLEEVGGAPVTIGLNERGHVSFNFGSDQQVDTLYLYLDPNSPLTPAQAVDLQWDLYTRNTPDVPWGLVSSNIPFAYNDDENRFELSVDINEQFIMVVTTNTIIGIQLDLTEVQAVRFVTEDTTTKTTSYKTIFGSRYRISQTMGLSVNGSYEHIEDENNGSLENQTDKLAWSTRLNWSPSPYFTPSVGYSEYREERTARDDFRNDSYSLSISSRPLPSVNLTLGYTHNDRYINDEKDFLSDVISLYGKFRIYPDLTTSVSTSYTVSESWIELPDSGQTIIANSETLSTRIDVTARLRRSLTAFVTLNQSISDTELSGQRDSGNLTFRLNYRPSDLLALQGSYTTFLGDDNRVDTYNVGGEIYLLRTYKSRLSLQANHIVSNDTIDNMRMIGSWDISDYLTFTGSGNYTIGPIDSYSLLVNLSIKL